MLSTTLTGAGLFLDIIGALVIAIPDIPWVREWFRYGKLRKGRVMMETEGVSPGEPGYKKVASIVSEIYDFREGESVTQIKMHSRGGSGMTAEENVWVYYDDRWKNEATDPVGVGAVYKQLNAAIESAEARFRVGGFILLAAGFSLQLVATFS